MPTSPAKYSKETDRFHRQLANGEWCLCPQISACCMAHKDVGTDGTDPDCFSRYGRTSIAARLRPLLHPRELRLRLLQNRHVGIGVFPQR